MTISPIKFLRPFAIGLLTILACVAIVPVGFRVAAALRETHAASEDAPTAGRYVGPPGRQVFIQTWGSPGSQPVLLVHGTFAWSGFWAETGEALAAQGYFVIALDLPPVGFSERSLTADYTRTAQSDAILTVIEYAQLRQPILVAHSFGAGSAVEAVMRRPDVFAGLELVDGALGLMAAGATVDLYRWPLWAREVIVASTITNPLATKYILAAFVARKEAVQTKYIELLQKPVRRSGNTEALARLLPRVLNVGVGYRSTERSNYGALTVPTRLIWGEHDTVTPPEQAWDLAGLIPSAGVSFIPNVGHMPQIEDPAAFHRQLLTDLAVLRAR